MIATETNLQPDSPEAREYNRKKRWLEIGDMGLNIGFLLLLLVTGWTNSLRDTATHLSPNHYFLRLFYYVLFLSILSKALGLGLDIYGFRLEHHFKLPPPQRGSRAREETSR